MAKVKCKVCKKTKPASDYYSRVDGRTQFTCKACWGLKGRAYYAANKERAAANAKRWAAANPEKRRAISRKYRLANPQQYRAHHWHRQGIDVVAAKAALTSHDGRCQLCLRGKPGGKGSWNVDHCHVSGKIRGILCNGCNLLLGRVEQVGFSTIAAYLEKHK